MSRLFALLLVLAALVAVAPATATAQGFDPRGSFTADDARRSRDAGRTVPLSEVVQSVRRQYPGCDVLDSRLIEPGGRMIYRVRIVTADGRRLDVDVDARSGRVLGAR